MIAIIVKSIIEVALIVLLIIGYIHEEEVVAFEQKLWKAACKKINRAIRNYERGKQHG